MPRRILELQLSREGGRGETAIQLEEEDGKGREKGEDEEVSLATYLKSKCVRDQWSWVRGPSRGIATNVVG